MTTQAFPTRPPQAGCQPLAPEPLLGAVAAAAAALLADGEDFAAVVGRGLRRLGEGAAVDRVVALEHGADPAVDGSAPGWLQTRFRWDAPGVAARFPLPADARVPYLPDAWERLRAGRPVSGHTADLPVPLRAVLARAARGVRSFALVPIFAERAYWGTLCFDSCRRTRQWEPEEIAALQTAAACVGGALAGERARAALRAEVAERARAEGLARAQAGALTRTLSLLAADPALDSLLGQVLTAVTEQLGAPAATLYFHDPAADTLALHMTYHAGRVHVGPDQLGHPNALVPFPAHLNGFWRVLLATRAPVEIADVEHDPLLEHHDWLSREGVRSLLIAPLVSGERTLGCLGVRFYEGPRRCRPEELALAQSLAQLATLAVELTRLDGQSRARAVAEERIRLAREIHDTLAQGLVGIFVHLQGARQALNSDAVPDVLGHLDGALDLAESSLAEARRSVGALRPAALEGRDLAAAFEATFAKLVDNPVPGQPVVELCRRGRRRSLSAEVETEMFRIGQEALANALAHARAERVRLIVAFSKTRVRVEVADDGLGFNASSSSPANHDEGPLHFGMLGMRERARRLGGRFTLTSTPGRGTRVAVSVPV